MSIEINRNDDASRYDIVVDGTLAGHTDFRDREGVLTFHHTEVDEAYAGQGLAGKLVTAALDDVRGRGETIVPTCPYVKRFVEKHPEYAGLLA